MSYQNYIASRRAKFDGINGYVNIPYGTKLHGDDRFIYYCEKPLCTLSSKNAHEHFSQDDDGNGLLRGNLVRSIKNTLERRDASYQSRWDKVWEDQLCQKYKRKEHEDFWLWNHDFYNAGIDDLKYIAKLVDAKEGR